MKIAAAYDDGMIHQHFGRCKNFKIYEMENNCIKSAVIAEAPGNGHALNAEILIREGVYALICGGIGEPAVNELQNEFIEVFSGCYGSCDDRVNEFLGKTADGDSCGNRLCGGDCGECGGCEI